MYLPLIFLYFFTSTTLAHDYLDYNLDNGYLEVYNNDFLNELRISALKMRDTDGSQCYSIWLDLLTNLSDPAAVQFLIKLIDSTGKIPSGITGMNLFNLGIFDMCYDSEFVINKETVYGKYCLAETSLVLSMSAPQSIEFSNLDVQNKLIKKRTAKNPNERAPFAVQINHGICIPSVCNDREMNFLVGTVLSALNASMTVTFVDDYCSSIDTVPDLTLGAKLTIAVLSIIGCLVLVSSIYDYYLIIKDQKPAHELLLAFSAITNGRKIFKSTKNPEQLLCLNGIRAISMAWVIIGHEYAISMSGPIENLIDISGMLNDKANMWLKGAYLAVDTFFATGGLVTAYTFLKSQDKGVPFNVPLYYLHRYLRLTPALGVVILITANVAALLGNGPMYFGVGLAEGPCMDYWWSTILYITNYVNPNDQCVGQSWYLAVDFQLFLLSPIVLYLLSKYKKIGYGFLLGILIPLGFVLPFVISYHYDLSGDTFHDTTGDYWSKYYIQTYTRFGPYVIGMAFGALIFNLKKNTNIPRKSNRNIVIALGLWIVALGGLVGSLYGGALNMDEPTKISNAFYTACHRNTWSIALGLLIVLCVTGFGGPINSFLSFPIFQVVTKLSYSMYLLHILFITSRVLGTRTPTRMSHLWMMHTFWADFMITLFLSFVLCVCCESPIVTLEKYLFAPFTKPRRKPEENRRIEA